MKPKTNFFFNYRIELNLLSELNRELDILFGLINNASLLICIRTSWGGHVKITQGLTLSAAIWRLRFMQYYDTFKSLTLRTNSCDFKISCNFDHILQLFRFTLVYLGFG